MWLLVTASSCKRLMHVHICGYVADLLQVSHGVSWFLRVLLFCFMWLFPDQSCPTYPLRGRLPSRQATPALASLPEIPSRMWTLTVVKHTWKSLKVSEIVGFPAMWFWLVILSDSYWFFPILTDWFLSCHVLPQRWNMIKNAEIIRNTISSRGSRNLCLFPAAGVWGQCRKANPLRSLGQTKGWECPPRIAHLFRG